MKQEPDKRLQNVKIKYGNTNISDEKFILPILESLKEVQYLSQLKKAGEGRVK